MIVLSQVYQTIGPDGKIRNKVRRVFKDTSNKEEKSQIVKFCNRDVIKGSHKTLETLVELEEIEELSSEPAEVLESSTEGGQVQVLQVYRTLGPDGIVRNRVRRIFKEEGTKKNTNVATKETDSMVQFHNVVGADDEQPEKVDLEEKETRTDKLGDLELPDTTRVLKPSPERESRVLKVMRTVEASSNIRNQARHVCIEEEEDVNNKANVDKSQVVRFCQTGGKGDQGVEEKVDIFKGGGVEFLCQLRMQVWQI